MKNIKLLISFLVLVLFVFPQQSCTNLDEEIFSDFDSKKFFENPENISAAVGVAYTNLYWTMGHKYGIGRDCGTDLLVVPQRGGDWLDGGEWHRYHRNQITPTEAYVEFWWNLMYKGVNTCNRLILGFETIDVEGKEGVVAELRAFRAFYYWNLLDVYGNVPLSTSFDVPVDFEPSTNSRKEVYDFIETELTEVSDQLSKETGLKTYSRVNYYVVQMILAKLYMNAEVYTGTAQYAKAEKVLDEIIDSGLYELESDYFLPCSDDASTSKEVIFGVPFDEVNAQGLEIHLFSLHYNLQENFGLSQKTWNGLAAQESLFNLFDENDTRRNGLLFGQQYDKEGNELEDESFEKFNPQDPTGPRDPDGRGLNLTPEINMLEPNCLRQAGARIVKWYPHQESDRYLSNDFPIYRYSDVLLMKAEAQLRSGSGDGSTAFNLVHQRAGLDAAGDITLDLIIDERARELFAEGHRRTDLIRFGKFLDPRWEKEELSSEHSQLWPIPEVQISNNPKLKQNPGY